MANSHELYLEARRLMDENNLDEAIKLFQQSISDYPHFKSLELLGECFIRAERLLEAVVPLAAATTLNKGVKAPSLLSDVFLKLKEYQRASETAEIALSREPNNKTAQEVKRLSNEMLTKHQQ